ncbi:hypothetical protein C0993_006053 [Termitomyces sp. T159_Od127]|nr:hypothetical protein C0993_006053 [Termitomyces sp. T159_Od127]
MGPRPLHLVDGNIALSPTTLVTQLPSPPLSTNPPSPFPKPNVRRHSSIAYRFSDHIIESPSLLSNSPEPNSTDTAMTSTSPDGEHERPPLTLVEKHSDLLHFIAQKESKCLELRSQLANLEAEIVQLKRKWERIVNRGFLNNPSASVSTSQGNGAVFEGIVGGVGRFIAAGLAIGEQRSPSPSPSSVTRPLPHSYFQSSATHAIKSSPLSQSPASSIAEGSALALATNEEAGDGELAQILMVHDTGATPTMSPNPAFEHHRQQQQQQYITQPDLEVPPLNNPKLFRRKSRDVHSRAPVPCEGPSTSSSQFESNLEATQAAKKEAMRAKRATVHGTNFPPVSSIPGLAALTVGPASPVPSLVESVGKKWEGLQSSFTFSKNQKRASVILSDVSQSIKSVLSSPSTSVMTQPSPPQPPPPSYFNPSSAESDLSFNRNFVTSLKNSDALISQRMTFGPDSSIPDPNWQSLGSTSPTLIDPVFEKTRSAADGEDAWNW